MASSLDLLNTTLAEVAPLKGGFVNQFMTSRPLWGKLLSSKKVNKSSTAGQKFEIPYGFGAPARAVALNSGFEQAPLNQANVIDKFTVESYRAYANVVISGYDLKRNEGANGRIKLIKIYPEAQAQSMIEDFEYWFLTGADRSVSAPGFNPGELARFPTLNGNVTLSSGDGGWLQMVASGSQSGNFQGVARSSTKKIINQYGAITSFAADGMTVIRRVLGSASQFGKPDYGFADGITYGNILANVADNVRIQSTGASVEGEDSFEMIRIGRTKVFNCDANLDPTNSSFSGTTGYSTSDITGGVLYLLSSDQIELAVLEDPNVPKFEKLQTSDSYVAQICYDMTPLTDKLACHGVIAGGRIP